MRLLLIADISGSSYTKVAVELMKRWAKKGVELKLAAPLLSPPFRGLEAGALHYVYEGFSVPLISGYCGGRAASCELIKAAMKADAVIYLCEPLLISLNDVFTTLVTLKEETRIFGHFALNYYPLNSERYREKLDACFDYIIPLTRYESELASQVLKECKVLSPVPHGVDLSVYRPSAWMAGDIGRRVKDMEGFKVLFLGRAAIYKDLGRWYRVLGELAARKVPVRGVVKVTGPLGVDAPLRPEALEDANSLRGRMFYVGGWLEEAGLASLISACDVFLTTSICECFLLSALEAQACGLPVVLPDLPSLREVYGDSAMYLKREGWWYDGLGLKLPLSSVEDAVEKLLLLYNDEDLREEWRAKSLENAQKYTWDAAAEKLIRCLEAG